MKNKANYDNILNIEETIGCMIKRLIPLYIEDYGEEYLNLIKKRISKTLYITSSTPEEEYKHFKKHPKQKRGATRSWIQGLSQIIKEIKQSIWDWNNKSNKRFLNKAFQYRWFLLSWFKFLF